VTVREDTQKTYIIRGKFLDFIPNKNIFYTWRVDAQSDYPKTTVPWTLEHADNSQTNVTLVHSGIIKEEHKQQANADWTYFLDRLVAYCYQNS
jgi:uncharacterized protein YndB with AHSA1/START domain